MYGIFTYIWVIFRANVGKYSIHGSYGYVLDSFFFNPMIWTDDPNWVHDCQAEYLQRLAEARQEQAQELTNRAFKSRVGERLAWGVVNVGKSWKYLGLNPANKN